MQQNNEARLVLRDLNLQQLREMLGQKRAALAEEEVKVKLGKAENSSLRRKIRRNVARILTFISLSKSLAGEANA